MWWPPHTDSEASTLQTVNRLADYFQTPGKQVAPVHAVGSVLRGNVTQPLLVIDHAYAPPHYIGHPLLQWLRKGFSRYPHDPRLLKERLLVPLLKAPADVRQMLASWDLPASTQLLFASAPVAQKTPGSLVWTVEGNFRHHATAGFFARVDGRVVLTTAGHLVSSAPCPIYERQLSFWQGETFERIGSVQVFNDPKTAPGVDAAVIELTGPYDGGQPAKLANPADLQELDVMVLNGGKSKLRTGWIIGALSLTRSLDSRTWRNCWNIVGIEGGFAQRGDSGGPVIVQETRTVVGHLVAALGASDDGVSLQCGVVQDAGTIRTYLRGLYKSQVEILDGGLNF